MDDLKTRSDEKTMANTFAKTASCLVTASLALALAGCASIEPQPAPSIAVDLNESYLDILNRQAKEHARRYPQKRHILLFGRFSEREQKAGALFRFPF